MADAAPGDRPPDVAHTLEVLLPGWLESATRHRLLDGASTDEDVTRRVADLWQAGQLRFEQGMWWAPPPGEPSLPVEVPTVPSDVAIAISAMRQRCDEGRPEEALQLGYATGVALMEGAATDPAAESHLAQVAISTVLALTDAGRVHAADPVARSAHQLAIERGSPQAQGWFAASLAIVEMFAGHNLDARRLFTEARIMGRLVPDQLLEAFATEGWKLTCTMVGQEVPVAIEPVLPREAFPESADSNEHAARTAAWADTDPRLAKLEAAAIRAKRAGRYGRAAMLAGELALLGNPHAACAIFERFGALDGDLFPLWPRIATALADGDTTELAAIATRLEDLGLMGLSSALTMQAAVFAEASDPEATRSFLREANRRAEGIQLGRQYLAQFRRLLPLREREHEIAELATRGLTNKQIAEKLVISVRTVENHLYRVYDKLGIEGRDDLVDLFSSTVT